MESKLNITNSISQNSKRDELISAQSLLSRMSKLIELSNKINGALDFKKIIQNVRTDIKWFFEYDYGIFCLNQNPKTYNPRLSILKDVESQPDFFREQGRTIENLLTQKNPSVISFEDEESGVGAYYNWGLALPLLNINSETIGFLFFATTSQKKYNEDDMRIGYMTSLQISSALQNTISYNEMERLNAEVQRERKKSDELLHAILPRDVSQELKQTGSVTPRSLENVSVMFIDFSGFTRVSDQLSASALLDELDYCFSYFDDILERYGVEKLKTIGDSYMCGSGLNKQNPNHTVGLVNTALDIKAFMLRRNKEMRQRGNDYWGFRIGIHSGPVMAGVIGKKKYNFDIWGRTVNIASRMESAGMSDEITVSTDTYQLIKDRFDCTKENSITDKKGKSYDIHVVNNRL